MAYRRTASILARLESARETILAAARALVAEGGWSSAQIALTAERAGVAIGTVYRHFPSKGALFSEVLADVSAREVAVVARVAESGGPAPQRLRDGARIFARRALSARRLAYAMVAEPCEAEIDRSRLIWRAELGRVFQHLIEEGVAEGLFRPVDARIAAGSVVGAILEPLVGPLAPDAPAGPQEADRLADAVAENALAIVAAPVGGPPPGAAATPSIRSSSAAPIPG